jgi:signal transduction histidine kinase
VESEQVAKRGQALSIVFAIVRFFSERSLVDRLGGRLRLFGRYPFRDHIDLLAQDPLGMFFYNQRALVFAASGAFIVGCAVALRARDELGDGLLPLVILSLAWVIGILATLALHPRFTRQLTLWLTVHSRGALPPLFDTYFVLDSTLLLIIFVTGKLLNLPFDRIILLLTANAIIYAAYAFGGHASQLGRGGLIAALFFVAVVLYPLGETTRPPSTWFAMIVRIAPVVATLLITFLSVTTIAVLSLLSHDITRLQLHLLGDYQSRLLPQPPGSETATHRDLIAVPYSDSQYNRQLRNVLRDLCARDNPFGYESASIWLSANHLDRGSVYIPGPYENVPRVSDFREGIDSASGFLNTNELLLVSSVDSAPASAKGSLLRFAPSPDVAAALIPLLRNEEAVGALLLYGGETRRAVPYRDESFLRSLGSIIATSMGQWQAQFQDAAHDELDSLFSCQRLDDIFPKAVKVLQRYLFADGCMIIFRPDPLTAEMLIVAASGFRSGYLPDSYTATVGMTGRCAAEGVVIRVDDVRTHARRFDKRLFAALERAHGAPIRSWMSVPIGKPPRNYGVIKVVNSTTNRSWFSDVDQQLGEDLAVRLQLMIELFLHVKRADEARLSAEESEKRALNEQRKAEANAKERIQDLMTVTHQQQGPLFAVVGALTAIHANDLSRTARTLLEHARALVEDAITLGYGTFTSFARAAGTDTAFVPTSIESAEVLRELAFRLQKTNSRADLRFVFRAEKGFPRVRMDKHAFTSVLYSLMHNAMKYAEMGSEVVLECGFERSTDMPAVKVKTLGSPIHPGDRELIFGRFKRGRNVDGGRFHTGVGLGLWVARELMWANGGDLTLELSPDHPRLAVFVIHFPVAAVTGGADG